MFAEHIQALTSMVRESNEEVRERVLSLIQQYSFVGEPGNLHAAEGIRDLCHTLAFFATEERASSETKQLALKSLVNLSGNSKVADIIRSIRVNGLSMLMIAMKNLLSSEAEAAGMLLSNLSGLEESCNELANTTDPRVLRLQTPSVLNNPPLFERSMSSVQRIIELTLTDQADRYLYLPLVLANLAQSSPTRSRIIANDFFRLYPMLHSVHILIKQGICLMMKNIVISEIDLHKDLVDPESNAYLVMHVLHELILSGSSDNLPDELFASHKKFMQDRSHVQITECEISLLETLLGLTATPAGRSMLRSAGAYEVVRNYHAAQTELTEHVEDIIQRIVDMLIRDELRYPSPSR